MISNLSILLGDWNAIRPEFCDALAALIKDIGLVMPFEPAARRSTPKAREGQ